ncbi:hypothetical protein FM119_03855 [Mycetocola reblochoni REB411]|uniref:Uncharacterized protein n=1 Tax=Mycetocola reblochoni REB411 TaxID=1255698 RepID=A0A1R4IWZ5_9MICO|nr:hypothetical protein FM119_03855 [Mycetocola reblochoni REB411]
MPPRGGVCDEATTPSVRAYSARPRSTTGRGARVSLPPRRKETER